MAKYKSRYKTLSVAFNGSVIQFENFEYETKNANEIKHLNKLQGADFVCISNKADNQDINALRLQARDLHYPDDLEKASKDDLIQFIESKK